jgi:hypothetical protein
MRRRTKRTLPPLAAGLLLLFGIVVISCSTAPPEDLGDSCSIFEEKGSWYSAARDSYKKWGVPIQVQLAIIYQESRFVHDAKPPRQKLLWVIPWTRPSSAYGYGQIKDSTWEWYLKSTGRRWADRDDFDDVADFIGWYGDMSHRKLGISKSDAYSQYLAYHEGHGGFKRKTYKNKKWLTRVASQVAARAQRYSAQLRKCEDSLDKGWWFF